MYQLPLRFISLSPTVAICATRIIALMSVDSRQTKEVLKNERKAGTLINASGIRTVKTAVILDNGTVVASPYSLRFILNKINKEQNKANQSESSNNVSILLKKEEDAEALEISNADDMSAEEDMTEPDDE